MDDVGSSVTLIFYRMSPKWWKEPALNVISAAAQMSSLTHCEIAIGGKTKRIEPPPQPVDERVACARAEEAGQSGTMKHVARIFNDDVGARSRPPPALACATDAVAPRAQASSS